MIGKLKHRIKIQQSVQSTDNLGGGPASWSTISGGTAWASVEPLSGRELYHAQQLSSRVTHRIVIRYLAGVTAAMRVLFGSRTFEIKSVMNQGERGRWLDLLCEETA